MRKALALAEMPQIDHRVGQTFEVFVPPAEAKIIATFLGRCRCPIPMNNADVEELFLVKMRHGTCENGIEAPLGLKAPKSGIDPGVVDFRSPRFVLLNRQLKRLASF